MFRKLLSNLPFNPSLIGEVAFYAKRLHREESLRRSGLILVVLAMLVQLFAVVSPPQPTLASSTNDIIPGGFANRDQAVLYCLDSRKDIGKIFAYYGITCDILAKSTTEYIKSTGEGKAYDSLGRNQQGAAIRRTNKPTNEYPVHIPGVQTLWMKNLWSWDSGAYSTYKVLRMVNQHGQVVRILYDCGNIVTTGEYNPPAPPPVPPATPVPTAAPKPTPAPRTFHPAICVSLTVTQLGPLSYRFRARTAGSEFVVTGYSFTFGDGNSKDVNTGFYSTSVDHSYASGGAYTARVAIKIKEQDGSRAVSRTVNCQAPVAVASTPTPVVICTDASKCLELSKSASNPTQKIDNADGTTAAAGDQIIYVLNVKNVADAAVNDFVIEENLNDVLDYATVTSLDGGKLDEDTGIVRWPAVDIQAGQTISRTITVKIKDPIPETPVSVSDAGRFDLVMTNVYGNAVNIKLPGSVVKTVEGAATTLPNTGPGTTVTIAAILTIITSYFFARSRLMAKELDIVREEYATTGGV